MKVLLIGSYGFMMNHLIERLHKERCEIYTVAGRGAKANALRLPAHSIYEFEPDDTAMKYIIRGVQPDVVIFMGAQDGRYDWERGSAPTQYSANLNNVLIWAKAYGVPRFVYLSGMDVFGAGADLDEAVEPHPEGAKALSVYSGECLCRIYHDGVMAVTILRFPEVYGPSHFLYEKRNPMERLCLDAKRDGVIRQEGPGSRMAVYVSDAVDAVYKTIKNPRPREILYHVAGTQVTDRQIAAALEEIFQDSVRVEEQEESACLSLDGSRFAAEFAYAPLVNLSNGLARTWGFLSKHGSTLLEQRKTEENPRGAPKQWRKDLRAIFAGARQTLENLGLFLIAFLVMMGPGSGALFRRVDVMLFYVLITAVSLGVGQSVFAVALATGANLYFASRETGLAVSVLIPQYDVIFGFLFYLILAIMISYAILRHNLRQRELEERVEDLQEEYDMLYEVDNTNVEIKRAFEQRLLNYGDSIGKIYSIVSELDVLDPEKVVQASLGVVQKIMKVSDVSIYRVGREGYYHLAASTGQEAWGMNRAFLLSDYPGLCQVLEDAEVFVDRSVGSGLPRMAAPICTAGRLIYIVMLWNLDFEQLNVYQKDLFTVLSRIITASLEKSFQYEEAGRNQKYYPNTDVLLPEAFRRQMEDKLGAGRYEDADYSLIRVDPQGQAPENLSERLRLLTREDDRLGRIRGEDPHIYVLIHANLSDSSFVVRKLNENGIKSEAVLADELQH